METVTIKGITLPKLENLKDTSVGKKVLYVKHNGRHMVGDFHKKKLGIKDDTLKNKDV